MEELRKAAKDLVAEARGRIENLEPDQVERELQGSDAVFVDLREADERERDGVIPGAVHVTRGMLEFRADPSTPYHNPALQPGRRIILHCASGGRSTLAAATLMEMGYANVAQGGGFKAWQAEGSWSISADTRGAGSARPTSHGVLLEVMASARRPACAG